jgi:tight adherence protein B
MSCYVLTAIPLAALAALSVIQPDYLAPLLSDPRGKIALGVAAVLQVIGYLVIQKMIKVKV